MNRKMLDPRRGTPSSGNSPKSPRKFNLMWIYLIIGFFLLGLLFVKPQNAGQKEIKWSDFTEYAKEGVFSSITLDRSNFKAVAEITPQKATRVFSKRELKQLDNRNFSFINTKELKNYGVSTEVPSMDAFDTFIRDNAIQTPVEYKTKSRIWTSLLFNVVPFILIIFFWYYIMRGAMSRGGAGGGIFNVGKSKAKIFDRTKVTTTFANVAGLQEAKQEVQEVVDFLKSPSKYTKLGGKIPKGVLLVGPPGTGKTLLAKAVAGEAHVPFFSMSGSDFVEMFVGVGASRVRDLFAQAKEKAPCIVFIDEIDAVGRARGKNNNLGGNDERENTLNQLLTEMDGFGGNSGVIVLAATNRVDVLDKALLRAGRFDRQIQVELPDINDRKEIFEVHMKGLKLASTVSVETLARQTPGFSGADIANVCNEAALIAARHNKSHIENIDFNNAIDRIIGGLEKKNRIITEEERQSIAIHEAGHATISWMLQYGNPLVKVTIVPRGKALGAAWYMPEERQITHTQVLLDEMCSLLGGRAAEELFLGQISTGAANDLERVTRLAQAMVSVYGMSEKLPNINYYDPQQEYAFQKPYSEKTAELIDNEVNEIIATQYQRAKDILLENKEGHHKIADRLLQEEVIYTEDVEQILGKRQWKSRGDELKEQTEKDTQKASSITAPTPPPLDTVSLSPRDEETPSSKGGDSDKD
ncbi:ATP-dependent metallopeptidase HflB [Bacteroidales bacterium KA00251]|nr:ATP-dependent metallopeptidase HflB [Bacteroidales bacterium KA00251]